MEICAFARDKGDPNRNTDYCQDPWRLEFFPSETFNHNYTMRIEERDAWVSNIDSMSSCDDEQTEIQILRRQVVAEVMDMCTEIESRITHFPKVSELSPLKMCLLFLVWEITSSGATSERLLELQILYMMPAAIVYQSIHIGVSSVLNYLYQKIYLF